MTYSIENPMPALSGKARDLQIVDIVNNSDPKLTYQEVDEMLDILHDMYLLKLKNGLPHILAYKGSYTMFMGL